MARSHTGTVTGDSWVYDVAFRQAGILSAADVDDLVDRIQFFDQLPRERWSEVRRLAVLTGTGGFASLAADVAEEEHVDVPEVERLSQWIGTVVPGAEFANPLDATGFVVQRPEIWDEVLATYAEAPEFDAFVYLSQFADWDLRSRRFSDRFAVASRRNDQTVHRLAARRQSRTVGRRVPRRARDGRRERPARHMAGPEHDGRASCAVGPMPAFPTRRRRARSTSPAVGRERRYADPRLRCGDAAVAVGGGRGRPVPGVRGSRRRAPSAPSFTGPYVVKLADVAHRTDHGAVCVGVAGDDLPARSTACVDLATKRALPGAVVVQAMVTG